MHRSWFSRLFGGSTRDEAFAPVPATEARKAEASAGPYSFIETDIDGVPYQIVTHIFTEPAPSRLRALGSLVDISGTSADARVKRLALTPEGKRLEGKLSALQRAQFAATFEAVGEGRIKALWIMGTNPAVSLPDADRVAEAIDRLVEKTGR